MTYLRMVKFLNAITKQTTFLFSLSLSLSLAKLSNVFNVAIELLCLSRAEMASVRSLFETGSAARNAYARRAQQLIPHYCSEPIDSRLN